MSTISVSITGKEVTQRHVRRKIQTTITKASARSLSSFLLTHDSGFLERPPTVQSLSLKGICSPCIQTADVDASISPWWCPNPALTNSLQDSQASWWNISEQEEEKKKKYKSFSTEAMKFTVPLVFLP